MGNGTFAHCAALVSVTIGGSPQLVIGSRAFAECPALTSVTIASAKSIGISAFCNCRSLASVSAPEDLTSIGASALYGYKALTDMTIPRSVVFIGEDAFHGCNPKIQAAAKEFIESVVSVEDQSSDLECTAALDHSAQHYPGADGVATAGMNLSGSAAEAQLNVSSPEMEGPGQGDIHSQAYARHEWNELKAWIERYKLNMLKEVIVEAEITVSFLLSRTPASITEIAAELTSSVIQQEKFAYAVEVARQEAGLTGSAEEYTAGSSALGMHESFLDDSASIISPTSLQ